MKRFWSVTAALAASLALTGCIPNESSIQVLHAVVPDIDTDSGGCLADPGGTPVASGFLDVGATNASLEQSFVARNNMAPNSQEGSERLNSRDFVLERAVVSYSAIEQSLAPLMEGLGERQTPSSGTIEAGADSGIWVNAIPRDVATVLATSPDLSDPSARVTVIVNTRIEGHMQNSEELSSSTISFPVEVCNRCRFCPADLEPFWACSPGQYPTCI